MIQQVETLIIGAGVIGSSVAMHLAKAGMTDIRVIDFDLEGSLSSSELNAGGVRATWVQPLNIQLSKASIDYFASVAEDVGYKACGYLWLHSSSRFDAALKARETQVKMGWPVDVLDLAALKRHAPFIDKTDGIAGAIFGPRDGLINPNLLKSHYRNLGRALGVIYDDRTLLRAVEFTVNGARPIKAIAERFENVMSHETKLEILSKDRFKTQGLKESPPVYGRQVIEYQAERIINCAGPWAAQIADILNYKSPAYPLRRQVCIFDCKDLDLTPYGMIVDTSGVYFHPEATNGLAGYASLAEPPGINYAYDGEKLFMDVIWPSLYERSSCFERLKHITGWSGLYEVSPDDCAILGPVSYNLGPAGNSGSSVRLKDRVFEAHSFSGHGVMQSYSAGLALSERIIRGRFETIDLSCMSADRFQKNEQKNDLLHEDLII
ncbi:MAG: FAD-binding oxidoreductase [Bdellovibrionia bacterium]